MECDALVGNSDNCFVSVDSKNVLCLKMICKNKNSTFYIQFQTWIFFSTPFMLQMFSRTSLAMSSSIISGVSVMSTVNWLLSSSSLTFHIFSAKYVCLSVRKTPWVREIKAGDKCRQSVVTDSLYDFTDKNIDTRELYLLADFNLWIQQGLNIL